MQEIMRVTRKNIKATAKFFPSLYSVSEYSEGFEVIGHGKINRSVFFRNDGVVIRTDLNVPRMSVAQGARVLGMLDCHWGG